MNTLVKWQKKKYTRRTNHYRRGKAHDVIGPLLLLDGGVHHEAEQHHDAALDFIPIYLRHLAGPISPSPSHNRDAPSPYRAESTEI